jgi:hypothetical protein
LGAGVAIAGRAVVAVAGSAGAAATFDFLTKSKESAERFTKQDACCRGVGQKPGIGMRAL